MARIWSALGIGALCALATAIASLLVAVIVVGTDRAALGALVVAACAGAVAAPVAWWLLGTRERRT